MKMKTALTESQSKTIMYKFQPIVYLHKDEQYFPSKISNFGITWSNYKMYDTTTNLQFTYKGPSAFDVTAPMLVSMKENSDGTLRISYVFFYAYNGCGPKASYKGKLVGLGESGTVNLCPADEHYGDIEHVSMYLKSDYSTMKNITIAYHQWSKTYTSDGSGDGAYSKYVSFDGNHPIIYAGKGSHASYPTNQDQLYYSLLDEYKKDVYTVYVKFTDYVGQGYKWTGYARLLKLNDAATSDITSDENYLAFKFYGAIGPAISNKYEGTIVDFLSAAYKTAKALSLKSLKNKIGDANTEFKKFYAASGVSALATGRSWW